MGQKSEKKQKRKYDGRYKRAKWWHTSFTVRHPDGRKERVRKPLNTTNDAVAEKRVREIRNSIDDGSYFLKIPTMREILDRYVLSQTLGHEGCERELDIASRFYSYFESDLVSKVTTSKLSDYKDDRLDGKLKYGNKKAAVSESTVKKELSFLRGVFNAAMELWADDWNGYFKLNKINPVKAVLKGMKDVERERCISPEEAIKLRKTLPSWLKPIVIFASQTGHRLGVIVHLELDEVILSQNRISVPAKKMKSKKPSVKKMTKLARATIETAIAKRTGLTNYVFVDEHGKPYSENRVSVAFGRACDAGGVKDLRFHDLKHDFGTLLAENDVEGYKRQQLLDHCVPPVSLLETRVFF